MGLRFLKLDKDAGLPLVVAVTASGRRAEADKLVQKCAVNIPD